MNIKFLSNIQINYKYDSTEHVIRNKVKEIKFVLIDHY